MVGIIILNYNTPDDVLKCVSSIKEHTKTEYRIYIVDNASSDNSYEIFLKEFQADGEIVLMKSETNNGFSAGNNIGIKRAVSDGCRFVCIINADILLINDAITVLKDKMEADPTVGVAAPLVKTPVTLEETQFARNKLTFSNFLAEKSFLKRSKRYCKKHPRYEKENEEFEEDFKFYGMTYGCMYLATAQFFIDSDYLDEAVFLFNEEDIMAHKLEKLSLKTLISPKASVLHNHHSSISKTSVANRVFHFRVSELIVLRKYDGASLFKLFPVICVFKLSWLLKSMASRDYRKLLKKYFNALNKVMKIRKKSGLENIPVSEKR